MCEPIRDTSNLWRKCRDLVDFNAYYQQCLSDMCSVSNLNVAEPACIILSVVARECALQGAVVNDWSTDSSVKGQCGMYYFCTFLYALARL